jgi:hypothetical protein
VVKGHVLDDEVVIDGPAHSASQMVIFHPDAGIGFPTVFANVSRHVEVDGELSILDPLAKHLWPRAIGARASILLVIITTSTTGVALLFQTGVLFLLAGPSFCVDGST